MDGGRNSGRMRIGSAEELLFELARHTADCVTIVDLDGRVLVWNPACENQYGWSPEEVIGREIPYVPEALRRRTIADLRASAAAGKVTEREAELLRSDGSRFSATVLLIPVTDADGHVAGVMTLVRDVFSDTRLDRQRETLAEMVAQHLKAPLSDMLVSAQLIRRPEVISDRRRRDAVVTSLGTGARRALRFVEDLSTLAAIEHGELEISVEPVDLGGLVGSVIGQVEGASTRVQLDFEAGMPATQADPLRLSAALVMLVDSALRVTPGGRPVGASIYRERNRAVIEIRDRGPMISREQGNALFSSFYTGPDPRGQSGARMGMFVVRGIVEAHGGEVSMEPAERGTGAVARVRLPQD